MPIRTNAEFARHCLDISIGILILAFGLAFAIVIAFIPGE